MEAAVWGTTLNGVTASVLIVDDHAGFRSAAREILAVRGYRVVGDASCRASALEAAGRLRPDAVLLDIRLGEDDGIEVARALRSACPGASILLVSSTDYESCETLRSAGAAGFLLKSRLVSADLDAYWPCRGRSTQ
jgi:DNA-binding NarL/FixJ family response regulator